MSAYCPKAGDTNIRATIASWSPEGNFIVRVWGDQSNPNSQIVPGATPYNNSNRNPLLLELFPSVVGGAIVPVGTFVIVDIVQGEYGIEADNARKV